MSEEPETPRRLINEAMRAIMREASLSCRIDLMHAEAMLKIEHERDMRRYVSLWQRFLRLIRHPGAMPKPLWPHVSRTSQAHGGRVD